MTVSTETRNARESNKFQTLTYQQTRSNIKKKLTIKSLYCRPTREMPTLG